MRGHLRSLLGGSLRLHLEGRARQAQGKTSFWNTSPGDLVACAGCRAYMAASQLRHSHSRPHQVPFLQRERAMLRPAESYTAATGRSRSKTKEPLYFTTTPTDPKRIKSPHRNNKFSHWRAGLKDCGKPADLLQILSDAFAAQEVDGSVISAAIQTCGHQSWWETLMHVHNSAVDHKVKFDAVERTIFINALAACLKGSRCRPSELSTRKDRALSLSKQAWKRMPSPSSELDFHCMIGAAWRVCAEIGDRALPWADEILDWGKTKGYKITGLQYGPLLLLLESCRRHDRVDNLIDAIYKKHRLSLTEVTLGGLINAVGSDWKRAEKLWGLLVNKRHVKPNLLCYTARSKVHFVAGRPAAAEKYIRDIGVAGMPMDGPLTVAMHLQPLLILYHSGLAGGDKIRLRKCLAVAENVDTNEAGRQLALKLKRLVKLSKKLLSDPSSLTLPDLIVFDYTPRCVMYDWPAYEAGSGYLPQEER
ncbi:unnamed protein product [Symbiodinium sp. CCMP2592]|nr:unnamed protein product [Symbiodinium sp. CCMP2592]